MLNRLSRGYEASLSDHAASGVHGPIGRRDPTSSQRVLIPAASWSRDCARFSSNCPPVTSSTTADRRPARLSSAATIPSALLAAASRCSSSRALGVRTWRMASPAVTRSPSTSFCRSGGISPTVSCTYFSTLSILACCGWLGGRLNRAAWSTKARRLWTACLIWVPASCWPTSCIAAFLAAKSCSFSIPSVSEVDIDAPQVHRLEGLPQHPLATQLVELPPALQRLGLCLSRRSRNQQV